MDGQSGCRLVPFVIKVPARVLARASATHLDEPMCVLCNQLWIEDHWSEVPAEEQPDADNGLMRLEVHVQRRGQRLRDRSERAHLVGLVLAGVAISLQDWEGSSYILRDAKGKIAVVHDLASVWAEVKQMTGNAPDPLDRLFIASLRERTALRAAHRNR